MRGLVPYLPGAIFQRVEHFVSDPLVAKERFTELGLARIFFPIHLEGVMSDGGEGVVIADLLIAPGNMDGMGNFSAVIVVAQTMDTRPGKEERWDCDHSEKDPPEAATVHDDLQVG